MITKNFCFDLYYVPQVGWKWSHNKIMDKPNKWAIHRYIRNLEKKNMMPDLDENPYFQRVIVRRSLAGYSYLVMPCRWTDWVES